MLNARFARASLSIISMYLGLTGISHAQLQFSYGIYDSTSANSYFAALAKIADDDFDIIDLTIHRREPWGTTHGKLWRIGGVFAEAPAVCSGFRCPAFRDTLDLVTFSSVDIKGYFERMNWAAPQYDNGLYLSLVKPIGDSIEVFWHQNVGATVLGTEAWNVLRIEKAEWVPFLSSDSAVLAVHVSQSAVGAGATHGDDREAFWIRDSEGMHYLGQISTNSHGGWGTFHRFGKSVDRRFRDVDGDGIIDLLIRRRYGYGTGPNTDCDDIGWIALKSDFGVYTSRDGQDRRRYHGGLRAFSYLFDFSASPLPIPRVPRLVFPKWNVPSYVPVTNIDSMYIRELDEMAFGDQAIKTMPHDVWNPEQQSGESDWNGHGGASILASIAGNNLQLEISFRDMRPQGGQRASHDIVVWTRPIIGTEAVRFDYGDTLYALIASPDSAGTSIRVTQTLVIGDDSIGTVDTLGFSIEYLSQKESDYSFVINIPSEFTSLSENAVGSGLCLFAVEVVPSGAFGRMGMYERPITQSENGFSRFHTATWGVLVEGRRTDKPPRERKPNR